MAFLQRSRPVNARKRPPPIPSFWPRSTPAAADPDPFDAIHAAAALLADAGCTLLVPPHQPPVLPSPHAFAARLARSLAADPDALSGRLLLGLAAFAAASPARLRQILLPTAPYAPSLARAILRARAAAGPPRAPPREAARALRRRRARRIAAAGRRGEAHRRAVSVAGFPRRRRRVRREAPGGAVRGPTPPQEGDHRVPPGDRRRPEPCHRGLRDQSHATVVSALEKLLQEDSEVVVADALSDLNLDEMLQDQAVTVAMSCVRTIAADQMPHLLRFLLLSATPANAGRIMLQIREQLKFVGVTYRGAASWTKKLKGKALASSTDGAILDTLRSGLRLLF